MSSPDLTPYLDLSIYDRDPQDIFENAVAELQINLPEWIPREGNIEVLLMEALALESAETVYAINRLPGGIVEVLLQLFGIARDNGAPPLATLQFNTINDDGYTIPEGTRVLLELPGGLEPVVFTTDVQLNIPSGNTVGTVSSTGDRFTSDANSTSLPTNLELLDSVYFVESVQIIAVIEPGRDVETEDVYFSRATQRFERLSDTLVLPRHFEVFALELPEFYRAKAIDNWDGDDPSDVGTIPGHITVATYGQNGLNTSQEKSDLEAAMQDIAISMLVVHVVDPTITPIDVTATVIAKPGYELSDVDNSVVAALEEYLSPSTWDWGSIVRRNSLIALITNVEGVAFVDTLTTPATDIMLTGGANLVNAGTIDITANPS